MDPLSQSMSVSDQYSVCRAAYGLQKERTKRAAQNAKSELDRLAQTVNIPKESLEGAKDGALNLQLPENEQELADAKKLLFMNTQVGLAQSILQNLLAQDAVWENQDFLYSPSEEQQQTRIEFYQPACKLLRSMELAFNEAAAIESSLFGPVWQASMDILKAHPKTCAGIVGGAGLLGALSGSGLVKLHIGFRGLVAYIVGGEATAASGALIMGMGAVVAVGAVIAIIALYQRSQISKDEAVAEELRAMKEKIKKIAQQELRHTDLLELDDLFSKAFHQPMRLALDEYCPVCHDHFRADGGNSAERAITSPNCVGDHMVHQKCFREWQLKSGSDSCIICRQ